MHRKTNLIILVLRSKSTEVELASRSCQSTDEPAVINIKIHGGIRNCTIYSFSLSTFLPFLLAYSIRFSDVSMAVLLAIKSY